MRGCEYNRLFSFHLVLSLACRAVLFQLPVGAGVALHAALFQLAVGAAVALRAVALRAVAFQLAVGAWVACRAAAFPFAVGARVALRTVSFQLRVRTPIVPHDSRASPPSPSCSHSALSRSAHTSLGRSDDWGSFSLEKSRWSGSVR